MRAWLGWTLAIGAALGCASKTGPAPTVAAMPTATAAPADAAAPLADAAAPVDAAPVAPPTAPHGSTATPEDQAMITALESAGVQWQSGAGKSVLLLENVACQEDWRPMETRYTCDQPRLRGSEARAFVRALANKKAPSKRDKIGLHYTLKSIRCRAFNEGDSGQPDACEVTP